jgi:hypothetical protein
MRLKLSYMTPLWVRQLRALRSLSHRLPPQRPPAGPGAAQQSCSPSASGTVCQSPGNDEINDSPPPVSFYPYGGDAFLLGGYGGGFHEGGGHR